MAIVIALLLLIPSATPRSAVELIADKRVTVSESATPLSRVLKLISDQTGVTVKAAPGVTDRIIVVQATSVPARELLDGLASVLYATVEQRSSGLFISEDKAAIRARSVLIQERRLTAVREAQDKVRSDLNLLPKQATNEPPAGISELRRQGTSQQVFRLEFQARAEQYSPGWPVLLQYVASLPAHELASIGPGTRVVFSNRPTQMQRLLPTVSGAVLTGFAERFNAQYRELHKLAASNRITHPSTFDQRLDVFDRDEPITADKVRVLISFERDYSLDPIRHPLTCQLVLVDDNGRLLSLSRLELDGTHQSSVKGTVTGEQIQFSERACECGRAITSLVLSHRQFAASTELCDFLAVPEVHDPLSLIPSEMLRGMARARHQQLIAWLPDACFTQLSTDRPAMALSEVESLLSSAPSVERSDSGGWIQVRPTDPKECDLHFTDRTSLRDLVREAAHRRPLPLQSVFSFLLANPGYAEADRMDTLVTELVGGPEGRLGFTTEVGWVRFIGHLVRLTPDFLSSDQTFQISKLPPAEQSELASLLYNARGPSVELAWKTDEELRNLQRNALIQEPTENFPDGMPLRGEIANGHTMWNMLRMARSYGVAVVPTYNLRNLSLCLQQPGDRTQDGRDIDAANALRTNHFAWIEPVELNWCAVKVHWSDSLRTSFRLIDTVPLGDSVKRVDDLPEAFRRALAGTD